MGLSFWELVIILAIVLIIFGAGKLPNVMGELGKGLRNFRKGIKGHHDHDKQKAKKKR
jgi:sec-independent protein translocase protein TatA